MAAPHRWAIKCLLCLATPDSPTVDQPRRFSHGDLVAMQEHGMVHHQLTQDDFIRTIRDPPLASGEEANRYRYKLPDGRFYLEAKRVILEERR